MDRRVANRHVEIDQSGRRGASRSCSTLSRCTAWTWDDCQPWLPRCDASFVPGTRYGSIYYTPGYSNGGWLNFSESSHIRCRHRCRRRRRRQDGYQSFRNHDLNGTRAVRAPGPRSLADQRSVMAYGEYTLEGDMNLTPFFEVLSRRRASSSATAAQTSCFPHVPGRNPFNHLQPRGRKRRRLRSRLERDA